METIKDLMIPLSEYAVIQEDQTIFEAFLALEKAQQSFKRNHYQHQAVLVKDRSGKIIGKLSQWDILRSLEPKYSEIQPEMPGMAKSGFSKKFLLSIMDNYEMFDKPMNDICKKAGMEKIKDYMHGPTEGEYIDETDSLDQAIHLLIVGLHNSLLVLRKTEIIGILRLVDVFSIVFNRMKECEL